MPSSAPCPLGWPLVRRAHERTMSLPFACPAGLTALPALRASVRAVGHPRRLLRGHSGGRSYGGSFHPDLNGLVVDLVLHLHDLSLLAFLNDGGDVVPVQVGVLHLRRKGLGHLHAPLGHADRDLDIDPWVASLHHPHPQERRLLLRLPILGSVV